MSVVRSLRKQQEQSTRKATERPKGWTPPNSMVMDINLGEDVKCRWVRKYFDGSEEDKTSLFKRIQRGWVPVKPEEVPHLSFLINQEGLIQQAGCILMKRDAEECRLDVEYYEEQALGAYQSAKKSFEKDDNNNSSILKFSETGKPSIFRGRQPS